MGRLDNDLAKADAANLPWTGGGAITYERMGPRGGGPYTETVVSESEGWDDYGVYPSGEHEAYIVAAANGYPEALRLLKRALKHFQLFKGIEGAGSAIRAAIDAFDNEDGV